jgi:ABC-type transport system substrate-binding protein
VRRNLAALVFETLVTLDDRGQPQPALAVSWEAAPGNQRWQFNLRRGVKFHDGSPLTSDAVAASLRAANPNWRVLALGDSVVIERDTPTPNLPAELALSRNSIVKRNGKLLGTGPFAISEWQPGKKLTVTAQDEYWGGRPFLDVVQLEMGKSLREQMIALDLGRSDFIEIAPEQAHRASAEGRRVQASAPAELMALVFSRERQSPEEGRLREALGLSIDRAAMSNVLLQGSGEPAGGLLPNWMSGYEFLFPAEANLARARQIRTEVRQTPAWTLGYDVRDPLARVIAERIALNARDAGLTLQPTSVNSADVRLVRLPLASLDAHIALSDLAATLGAPQPGFGSSSPEELYAAEKRLLQSQRVIPLLHLRAASGLSGNVRSWTQSRDGSWRMTEVWLGAEKP